MGCGCSKSDNVQYDDTTVATSAKYIEAETDTEGTSSSPPPTKNCTTHNFTQGVCAVCGHLEEITRRDNHIVQMDSKICVVDGVFQHRYGTTGVCEKCKTVITVEPCPLTMGGPHRFTESECVFCGLKLEHVIQSIPQDVLSPKTPNQVF